MEIKLSQIIKNVVRNIVLGIGMLLLIACTSIGSGSTPKRVKQLTIVNNPILFEFNGHEYIFFQFSSHKGGVVHNPDCHCYQQNK